MKLYLHHSLWVKDIVVYHELHSYDALLDICKNYNIPDIKNYIV